MKQGYKIFALIIFFSAFLCRVRGESFLLTDYLEVDHSIAKAVFFSFAAILLGGIVILYFKYRNEKIKEAIEEAKHKEELLRSEARFRGLIEFGADGILLGSHDGYIIEVNEMACSIIGMKKEDLIGKFVTAVPFTKESLEKAPLRFDLLKEGKTVVNERDILRPDGSIVNLEMKTKMMADGSYQSIFRDITSKKTAEKEINSLKSWFEYVLGATKTGFDIIDENNNVIYVDPKWAEELGEFKGKKCFEYFMGRSKPCPDCAIPDAINNGASTISEEFLEKENRFVEVHTIPLNETRNGKRLVSEFNIDITEKKNREKSLLLFMEAVESSTDAVGISTPDGKHYYQNRIFSEMFGNVSEYPPESLYVNKKTGIEVFEAIISGKDWSGEVEMYSANRTILTIMLRAYAIKNQEGKVTGLVGIHTDISEKKEIEKKLKEFNAELEKKVAERTVQLESANKELESFSYSVSHDLRAPVRHILGFTDIFLKEKSSLFDERSKDIFSKITASAGKMEKLIDDLLTLSRTGRQDMTKKDIDMGSIVRSVTEEFKDCKEDRKVKINIAEMPVVKADHNLIKAVWENLIDNACKYTKKKAETEIFIGCRTEGGEHIFFIEDNGVGFDPEFSHKLFGVFQRLHLDKDFPGTGIGLANVRRIITRHGGRTWAESKGEEQGAVFYFSLPIN